MIYLLSSVYLNFIIFDTVSDDISIYLTLLPCTFSFYACCLFPFPAALPVDGAKPGLSFATYLPRCHFLIPSFSPFPLSSFLPLPLLRQGDFLCRFLTLWQQACVFLPRPLCPCLVTRLAFPFLYSYFLCHRYFLAVLC